MFLPDQLLSLLALLQASNDQVLNLFILFRLSLIMLAMLASAAIKQSNFFAPFMLWALKPVHRDWKESRCSLCHESY